MSGRGFSEMTVAEVEARNARIRGGRLEARPVGTTGIEIGAAKKSKYRNVATFVGTERFDSKREADYFLILKAREQLGEISDLRRQVRLPLLAPNRVSGQDVLVSEYVADFTYCEAGRLHVVDAKGVRTQLFRLKAKWLELQDAIIVEEV